jgi:hypothetical protein
MARQRARETERIRADFDRARGRLLDAFATVCSRFPWEAKGELSVTYEKLRAVLKESAAIAGHEPDSRYCGNATGPTGAGNTRRPLTKPPTTEA